jgi:hypothetical protein
VRSFKKFDLWAKGIIVIGSVLVGSQDILAADPIQFAKDQEFMKTYQTVEREIIDSMHRIDASYPPFPIDDLARPYLAVSRAVSQTMSFGLDLPYYPGQRQDRSQPPSYFRVMTSVGAGVFVGMLGGAGSLIHTTLMIPKVVNNKYQVNKVEKKYEKARKELGKHQDEMARIKAKDTPLTWAIKQKQWDVLKASIDQGADLTDQDSVQGPRVSALALAKTYFPEAFGQYMRAHEKKLNSHILAGIDGVCDSNGSNTLVIPVSMKAPMDIIYLVRSYYSNESELQREAAKK